jgi:ATP-dependent DNA helicase RecQ
MGTPRNMTPHCPPQILRLPLFPHPSLDIISVIRGQDVRACRPAAGSPRHQIGDPRAGVGAGHLALIALMQDQFGPPQNGLRADFLNSSLAADEVGGVERRVLSGAVDLLYVAPERLLTESFQRLLQRIPLALFAIDEAHCVSQWGHDFRPEYLRIADVTKRFGGVPKIALTATADAHTRQDIIEKLELSQAAQFVSSFDRPNIRYRVQLKNNGKKQLHAFMRDEHPGQSGIVYVRTRKRADAVAAWLATQGVDAVSYHAGLEQHVRLERQRRFLRDASVVIVATIAFGMGIDKLT